MLNRHSTFSGEDQAEHELEKCGVRVQLVEENFGEGVEGYLSQQMTVLMDGMYPKMVSKWTRTKLTKMAEDGYFMGGTIPFGFRTEYISEFTGQDGSDKKPPQRLVADEREAGIVREAFDTYIETSNFARVRDYLKAVTDRQWTSSKVKNLLINEAYVGNRTIGGKRYEGICPALVIRDIWDQVQSRIGEQGGRCSRSDNDYMFYLRGKIRCPHCDCTYTTASSYSKTGKKVHYYVCLKHMKSLSKCPVARINADALHQTVLYSVRDAAEHETVMRRVINNSGGWESVSEAQIALRQQLVAKRKQVDKEIGNLTNAIANGGGFKSLLSRVARLEDEQDETTRRLAKVEQEIAEAALKRPSVAMVRAAWTNYLT